MTFTQIIILIVIGILFIWAIVERICSCLEKRAEFNAMSQILGKPDPKKGLVHPKDIYPTIEALMKSLDEETKADE